MLNETNIRNYLASVAVKQPEASMACIKDLQNGHVGRFPFSSLGVLLHDSLALESDVLFTRVVTKRRGGYCFEHNKIFFEVLTSLGFRCDIVMARVLLNGDRDVPRTHRISRIALAGARYIVDVGFGPLCPREPLLLDMDTPQNQGDAVYRILQPDPGRYLLQIQEAGGWLTLYSFDNGLYTEADCLCGHHYSSTHPNAVFVNNLVVSLKSYDDVRLLRNGEFLRIRGGETAITDIFSQDTLGVILLREFGINLTSEQLSRLYERYCARR